MALFAGAAAFVAVGLAWPKLILASRERQTRIAAASLLDHAVAAERTWASAHLAYGLIQLEAADVDAGRQRSDNQITLNASSSEVKDFLIEALPRAGGSLLVRVISQPEAIRQGETYPVLLAATLPPLTAVSSAPVAAAGVGRSP